MALTKEGVIRLSVIDKCLRDTNIEYTKDLIKEECNRALYRQTGNKKYIDTSELIDPETGAPFTDKHGRFITKRFQKINPGVDPRTIWNDIKFIKKHWNVEIVSKVKPYENRKKEERTRFYRYKDPNFSIFESKPSQELRDELKKHLEVISYFNVNKKDEGISSQMPIIADALDLNNTGTRVILEERHPNHIRYENFNEQLYSAIIKKQVLKIIYEPFGREKTEYIISPYFLKEYNTRWSLYGYNHKREVLTAAPIDRILSIEHVAASYIHPDEVEVFDECESFADYFDDVIGTTINAGEPEEIILEFSEKRIPYVLTKPLHGSQKKDKDRDRVIKIKVIPNNELIQTILSFGKDVKVLHPQSLRDEIKEIVRQMSESYEE